MVVEPDSGPRAHPIHLQVETRPNGLITRDAKRCRSILQRAFVLPSSDVDTGGAGPSADPIGIGLSYRGVRFGFLQIAEQIAKVAKKQPRTRTEPPCLRS
jgi:hypothetical protein